MIVNEAVSAEDWECLNKLNSKDGWHQVSFVKLVWLFCHEAVVDGVAQSLVEERKRCGSLGTHAPARYG